MSGYTKLFVRILDSTIWQEDNPTRILWITMLAMVDRDGLVLASIPGLAKRANISLPECEAALAKFQEPDQYSQSQVAEGRRIEVVPGGWHLINYDTYRHQLSAEEQREKDRLRKAAYRMSQNLSHVVPPCPSVSQTVPASPAESDIAAVAATVSVKSRAKAALRAFSPPTLEEVTEYCKERNNGVDPVKFHAYYTAADWYRGRTKIRNWKGCVHVWESNNYGSEFQGGYHQRSQVNGQASKHQQRVANNRSTILAGLGIGPMPGQREPSVQDGDVSGGSPDLATRLLKGKS